MNGTMGKLGKMQETEYSNFVRVLFGLLSPSPVPDNSGDAGMEWVDPSLNNSQKHAIKFALASKEMALIHGPPGVSATEFSSAFGRILGSLCGAYCLKCGCY